MHRNSLRLGATRWLVASALLTAAFAAQAALVIHTSQSSFNAAVSAPGLDSFDSLPSGEALEGPLARTAGAYAYTVAVDPDTTFIGAGGSVPPGFIVAAGPSSDVWLSTNSATDTLRFFDLSGVSAMGGLFFGSDIEGLLSPGASIEFLATDAQGTQTFTLTGATAGSFVGFVSDTTMVSLAVRASQASGDVWVTVNDLQLAGAVPEPQSLPLLLSGLAALAFAGRRRKA